MAGESFLRGMKAQSALEPVDQLAELGSTLGGGIGQFVGQKLHEEMTRGQREQKALSDALEKGYVDLKVAKKIFPSLEESAFPVASPSGVPSDIKLVHLPTLEAGIKTASAISTAEEQRRKIEELIKQSKEGDQPLETLFQTPGGEGLPPKQMPLPEELAPYGKLPVDTFKKLPGEIFKKEPKVTPYQREALDLEKRRLDIAEGKTEVKPKDTNRKVAGLLGMISEGSQPDPKKPVVITTRPQAEAFVQAMGGDLADPEIQKVLNKEWTLPGWFGMSSKGKLTGASSVNTPAQAAAQAADPILDLIQKKKPNPKEGEISKVGGKPYAVGRGGRWQKL